MATDPFEQEEGSNPFGRMLKNGLVLAPIALAGYTGYQRVSANSALNPLAAAASSLRPGRLGQTGLAVGESLAGTARDTKAAQIQQANKTIENLLKEDGIQKLFQNVEEQRAVIQTLLETMDDPSSGMPEDFVLSYREKLSKVAQEAVTGDDAQEVVRSVVRAMSDDSLTQNARARWASNLREYRNVSAYLTPPSVQLEANQLFNPVNISQFSKQDYSALHRRYNHLIQKLGPNGSNFVSLAQFGEGATQQVYARIFSGNAANGQGRFLGAIPLHLGSNKSGYTGVRMNENLTTGYRANRMMLDAQKAQSVFKMYGTGNVTMAQLHQHGAFVDLEDYFLNEFIDRANTGGGKLTVRGGRNAYGAWQRQYLGADARLVSSGQAFTNASGMSRHIRAAAGFQHNVASIGNFGRMDSAAQQALIQNLATVQGMESGVSAGRILGRGLDNQMMGAIGLYEGSTLSALKSTALGVIRSGGGNMLEERGLFPTTSRLEQVTGREAAFVGGRKQRWMGKNNVFSAGAVWRTTTGGDIAPMGNNIEWAESVTGGTNKAVVMDVSNSGKLYNALEGTGAAYHTGRARVRHAFTKPVLEPGTRGGMGSKLLNEIIARVEAAGGGDNLVSFTPNELRGFGNYLGAGPSGLQFLRNDPRTTGARLGYRITEVGGKKHINIVGEIERELETFKGFSLMHKGTVQEIKQNAVQEFLGSETLGALKSINALGGDTIYTSGDMLKKGAGFFDLQLTSAFGLVTGDKNFRDTLAKHYGAKAFAGMDSHLGRVTGAAIRGMSGGLRSGSITAEQAGLVLGAIYTRGEDWVKGLNSSQAVSQQAIADAVKQSLGTGNEALAKDVIAAASRGIAIGATTMTHGSGVGDYGLGRGSVEPRFFSNLQHRLRRMGMSTGQTSDFLAGIYRNKLAYGQHLTSAQGMLKLAESVAGVRGASDAANMLRAGVPTYSIGDMATIAPQIKADGFESFMAKHSEGFVLDLTKGASTPAQRAMASSAADVFRQGQIFIPGSEVLNAMRGTMIKTATGAIPIQDEYSRMVAGFMDDLATLASSTEKAKKSSTLQFQAFKEEAVAMAGKVIHQVAGGKIRGLQSQVAALYDLTERTGFSSQARAQLAVDLHKHTRGMSVHMDTKGFLSQLKDFMGGTIDADDAARKAERFFLSLEGNLADTTAISHNARGIVGIGSRHPLVSLGNVAPVQIFRHVEEVGRGTADEAFQKFIKTGLGKKYAGMKGFSSLKGTDNATRSAFFRDFVGSLDEWIGEGGGRVFLPRRMEDIHYIGDGGKPLRVDMGISGAAVGDFDGDQYQMLMVNENSGKTIMSTLGANRKDSGWLKADNIYKIKSEIFASEAKKGLKKHEIGADIGFADVQRIQQDLMKESASKNLVGSLDVRMNKLRAAILDMSMQGKGQAAQAEEAMALLKVVQEHAVIKGKKLPVFKPFAEMLNKSIDAMFDGAGSASLRRVMSEEIFPGSSLLGAGFQITGGTGGTVESREAIESLVGGMMRLDNTMDFIDQAVNRARNTGVADYPSQARMAMAMGGDNIVAVEKAFNAIRSGQNLSGAMLAGFEGDAFKRIGAVAEGALGSIRSAAMRLDRKTQGLIAMGGMAAMGIGAMVSNEGYGAEPLVGPMEVVDAGTRNHIASGQALQHRDQVGPRPENFQRAIDPYATMGRPIQQGATYMRRPSSYQVRGEVYSEQGLGVMGNYMGAISGGNATGSVRINDARRPITANYVDRLLGEY